MYINLSHVMSTIRTGNRKTGYERYLASAGLVSSFLQPTLSFAEVFYLPIVGNRHHTGWVM